MTPDGKRNNLNVKGEDELRRRSRRLPSKIRVRSWPELLRRLKLKWPCLVCGVDEAGRGPLAGPVVAAAVVVGDELPEGVKDSKLLSPSQREELAKAIREKALAVGLGVVEVDEINSLRNILNAAMLAMKRALEALPLVPEIVLVDGTCTRGLPQGCVAIPKGDRICPPISAASIIAKVERDRMMVELDKKYPGYGLARHKGYPTKAHKEAILKLGPSPVHRIYLPSMSRLLGEG